MQHATGSKKLTKACDACRRRKIKCNGSSPCPGCISAKLACTFLLPRGQGGNRGPRATVLNDLRAKQQENTTVASPTHLSPSFSVTAESTSTIEVLLDQTTLDTFIDAYLANVHPVIPLLDAEIIQHEFAHANDSTLSNEFVLAFCSYIAHFGDVSDSGRSFLNAAQAQSQKIQTSGDHHLVYISFFLYGAYAGYGDYRQAWFYLRQATTLFMMLGNEDQEWFDKRIRRRLFWVLLISERAHAVRRNRPITLQITPVTPDLDSSEEKGISYLAAVFRPLDETFFAVWNGSPLDCSKDWLLRLESDVRYALPSNLDVSNEEIANIRVSQAWLQIKLWELFPRYGFLSTESVYECLTFRYPILVARNLTILAMKLPFVSFQVHGVGMTEKVFDIACALTDVMPFVHVPDSQLELGPADYLTQTASLIAKLPGGSARFVPLLLAKVNELMPELVNTMCEAMQLPTNALNPLSPDTQFIYEEEVGRGLYTDLRRGH